MRVDSSDEFTVSHVQLSGHMSVSCMCSKLRKAVINMIDKQ